MNTQILIMTAAFLAGNYIYHFFTDKDYRLATLQSIHPLLLGLMISWNVVL